MRGLTQPEDEDLKERCIYLRPYKGGSVSNIIIPVVRREPPPRAEIKRQATEEIGLDRGESMNPERKGRNETKRVTSLPRQTINDHSVLKKKANREISSKKPAEFSKTASEGFGVQK